MITIRIDGPITPETTLQLADSLRAADGEAAVIVINSPGGSATEGAAIYAEILAYPGEVTVIARGIVASAASLIFMAGDIRLIAPGTMLMVHDPSASVGGTAGDLRRGADTLDQMAQTYAAVYADRSGLPLAQIRKMMAAETWFDADEAVRAGFATGLEGVDAPEEPPAIFAYATAYRHPPEILAQYTITRKEPAVADEETITTEKAPDGAEMHRARTIRDMGTRVHLSAEFIDGLIDDGVSLDAARTRILDKLAERSDDPPAKPRPTHDPITMGHDWDRGPDRRAKFVDAIQAKLDPKHEPTMGREFAGAAWAEMAFEWDNPGAGRLGRGPARMAGAPHTRSDFPILTGEGLTAVIGRQFEQYPPALAQVSRQIDAVDYRAGKVNSLSATSAPDEVSEGGEIKYVTLSEAGEAKPVPRDFGAIFSGTKKLFVDDAAATATLQQLSQKMLQGATERLRTVLLEPIIANTGDGQTMTDSNPMFDSSHSNVAGSGAAISVATLSEARQAMRLQTGPKGELLNIEPRFLIVGAADETAAEQVLAEITANTVTEVNPFARSLEIVVEPGITTGWYLAADPARHDGLAHAFLDGMTSPEVQTREGWDTLGFEWRLVWALDAKFIGTRGWYRNPGA